MDKDALRDQLANLHRELGAAAHVDPQSRQLLVDLMHDITRLTAADPPTGASGLPGRLESVAVQFEADHPGIAAGVRRFVDILGKAGL